MGTTVHFGTWPQTSLCGVKTDERLTTIMGDVTCIDCRRAIVIAVKSWKGRKA